MRKCIYPGCKNGYIVEHGEETPCPECQGEGYVGDEVYKDRLQDITCDEKYDEKRLRELEEEEKDQDPGVENPGT